MYVFIQNFSWAILKNFYILFLRPRLSQQYQSSDTGSVPDAPSPFEAPLLSSQRSFCDIQASQLYKNPQTSGFKAPYPRSQLSIPDFQEFKFVQTQNNEKSHRIKPIWATPGSRDLSVSEGSTQLRQNSNQELDLLSSQLYRNTQTEKKSKTGAHDTFGSICSYDNVDSTGLIPRRTSVDFSGLRKRQYNCSIFEKENATGTSYFRDLSPSHCFNFFIWIMLVLM